MVTYFVAHVNARARRFGEELVKYSAGALVEVVDEVTLDGTLDKDSDDEKVPTKFVLSTSARLGPH